MRGGRVSLYVVVLVFALSLVRPPAARAESWTDPTGTAIELPPGWHPSKRRPELPFFLHDATGLTVSIFKRESCASTRSATSRPDFADAGWTWVGQATTTAWELELCRPSQDGARLKLRTIAIVVSGPPGQTDIGLITPAQRSELTSALPLFTAFAERGIANMRDKIMAESFGSLSPTYTLVTTQNTPAGWGMSSQQLLVHRRMGLVARFERAGESTTMPCRDDNIRLLPALPSAAVGGWMRAGMTTLGGKSALMLCRTYQQWSAHDNRAWGAEMRLFIMSAVGDVDFEAMPLDVESAVGTLTASLARDADYRPAATTVNDTTAAAAQVTAKAANPARATNWGTVWEEAHDVTVAVARSYSRVGDRSVDGGSLDLDILKNVYASSYQEGVELHFRFGGFGDEMADGDNRIEGAVGLMTSSRPKGRILGLGSFGAAFDSVHHYGFGAAFYAKVGAIAYLSRLIRFEAAVQGFVRTGPNQLRAMGSILLWRLVIGGEIASIGDLETSQFSVGLRFW